MKSKTHSKKCVDLGVSVGLIDEQDTEESGKALFHIFHKCYLQCTLSFFFLHPYSSFHSHWLCPVPIFIASYLSCVTDSWSVSHLYFVFLPLTSIPTDVKLIFPQHVSDHPSPLLQVFHWFPFAYQAQYEPLDLQVIPQSPFQSDACPPLPGIPHLSLPRLSHRLSLCYRGADPALCLCPPPWRPHAPRRNTPPRLRPVEILFSSKVRLKSTKPSLIFPLPQHSWTAVVAFSRHL